jgi:hypothetical protein
VSVEVTGGREWLATLDAAVTQMPDQARKVVSKGSLNIKKDWRQRWSGHPHIPRLPYAISYDVTARRGAVEGEIGPDKDRGGQAPLGNIIEFGSPTSAPIPGGLPALEAEGPRFEAALAMLATKLLEP